MRRTGFWMALLAFIVAGAIACTSHQVVGPQSAAAKPTESRLLHASGMPRATAPITVPGGYQAAAWDEAGHVTFWKWTAGAGRWSQVGASTYPVVRGEPIDTTITGAVLPGMTDATFIAHGFFSGDGTGSYIALTGGLRGWGAIAPGPGEGTLIPTGNASTDNATPGNSYAELFNDGDLDRIDPGSLPFGPNGEEWQIERSYAWRGEEFRQVSTTQFTARPANPLPQTALALPAACQGAQSGIYQDFMAIATTTFRTPIKAASLPASVTLRVQDDGPWAAECTFTVAPNFPVVISAQTSSGTTWITAPAWALTQGTNDNQDIGDLLPGAQLPGQDGLGAIEFEDPGSSPYYIPQSLGISQIGPLGTPIINIHNGRLTALTLLPV